MSTTETLQRQLDELCPEKQELEFRTPDFKSRTSKKLQ
jgi:hypothetical protein